MVDTPPDLEPLRKPRFLTAKEPPTPLESNPYSLIWVVAAWIIIGSNALIAFVTIRDMFQTVYNPYNHYFMTCAFTFTLGILALIQTYVINKR